MTWANKKTFLFASTAIALSIAASGAHAGAFAIREQSAYFQGTSFAGYGTSGETISAMYWNPASLIGAQQGWSMEAHGSLIIPNSEINGTLTGGAVGTSSIGSGDIGLDAFVPATYISYRPDDKWVFGVGINSPFGLTTKPNQNWAAQFYSRSSRVFSINVNPNVAYKINDMFAVAVGFQVQYLDVSLKSADATSGAGFPRSNEISGDGFGVGVTAGVTIKPIEGTEIGIGYRSGVGHDLSGQLFAGGTRAGINLGVVTPDMVNISAKQKITDKIRLLGTVEWTNWSRLKSPVATSSITGSTLTTLHFNYDDGWFFSVGGEYDYNDKLTFRAGLGYEISPIDEAIRSTRLPDNNRWWLSAGASYNFSKHIAFDLGFTHIITESTGINIDSSHQDFNAAFGTYKADVDSNVNILSASLRYKF
ncbi:OmpP1/FadL family transporter [Roseibium album]|uniref:Outer membrane flp protein n=1 Tax=Roseibium album TaxID=311410 RepID=A0A0M6ZSC8_9HYPH|nr:OmpP1/FadL family transporter [Roseibium album]CTQ59477.1 Outer membrane flp protein [Roseibium album]CTQ65172.1 Outer membrane flp protein [Roseibium album]CTQ75078.1 Outer membrane flp protein [Roseibium album]